QEAIMPNSRPGRARPFVGLFRFRLRTLLLAVPLAGVLLGTLGVSWHRDWRVSQAEAAIEALEGAITRDEQQRIVTVQLSGERVSDAELRRLVDHLVYLHTLQELSLTSTNVSDAGLVELAQLRQLQRLTVFSPKVSDAGIARLTQARPDLEISRTPPHFKATGLAMRTIFDHATVAVAFSPDGQTLVAGSGDGMLRFWDLAAPQHVLYPESPRTVRAHRDWVFTVAFRPDGALLATGGGDDVIRLWDAETRKLLAELIGHEDDVHAIAFSPDGETLFSTGDDATVRAWDVDSQQPKWIAGGHTDTVPALAIHPLGRMLATGSRDDEIRLWSAAGGEPLAVLRGHAGDVMSLAFSPDGKSLVSAGYDETLQVWEVASGRTTRILTGPADWAFAVAWSADGSTIAGGAGDGLRWWDADTGRMLFHSRRPGNVAQLAFRGDGHVLASASAQGDVRLWNVPGRYEKARLRSRPTLEASLLACGSH
ncbi:MAG: WD40 repeat domain-containing protein, partial [Planctomycetes bacterium]|nr:WD40 repeat domain-containing protein [Planctomycetota bacterium]